MKRHTTFFVTLIVLVLFGGTSRINAQQSFSALHGS
jgi:hypothetical protein